MIIIDCTVCLRSHLLLLNNKLKIHLMEISVDVQVFIVTVLCVSCDHCLFLVTVYVLLESISCDVLHVQDIVPYLMP